MFSQQNNLYCDLLKIVQQIYTFLFKNQIFRKLSEIFVYLRKRIDYGEDIGT